MTDPSSNGPTPFPEELLSGYIDGALTRQEEERVRIHLERSPEARALTAELTELRRAIGATRSAPPPLSTVARWLGRICSWCAAMTDLVGVAGIA
jgi:anti-sigma factor RsiW